MADLDKKTQESVKQAKKSPASSTQTFLKIAEIKNDTVVLKNGGLRGVLKVSSINFNLKSEDEQNAIIYSYQGFLNTLEYPIQIVVRSKKLDIDDYLEDLKKVGDNQTNQLLQQQTYEYIEYVSKLVEYADIMEKEFFVVVPYDPFRAQKLNIFQKFFQNMNPKDNYTEVKRRHEEFAELKKKLSSRINTVKVGLENCGLQVEELDTKALIELYYQSYNPTASRYQKLDELEETQIKNDTEIGRAA
ncbi:MAG TPA: hypothetical protein PKA32_01710 [Candidatus Gracilibacteria bacterium]|nr:hypothetical protein [Candidatus Gracilibacteria bacterium]